MVIKTTRGWMPESFLEKNVLDESAPCGHVVTTTWRWRGEVVKQDVVIYADKFPGRVSASIGGAR